MRRAPATLLLEGGIENYGYLNRSRREVDGIDDKEEWSALRVRSNLFFSVLFLNKLAERSRSRRLYCD
jgi:hypothetical protein